MDETIVLTPDELESKVFSDLEREIAMRLDDLMTMAQAAWNPVLRNATLSLPSWWVQSGRYFQMKCAILKRLDEKGWVCKAEPHNNILILSKKVISPEEVQANRIRTLKASPELQALRVNIESQLIANWCPTNWSAEVSISTEHWHLWDLVLVYEFLSQGWKTSVAEKMPPPSCYLLSFTK